MPQRDPDHWLSPSAARPARLGSAGDATKAAEALSRARSGEALVYRGDYHNARQLLAAMGRRLAAQLSRSNSSPASAAHGPPSPPAAAGGEGRGEGAVAWRADRTRRRAEHEILSRLVVPIEPGFRLPLRRAPDLAAALAEALDPDTPLPGLLPLRDVLGMVGAHEWRRKGVFVPALGARVHPHYGVYAPVRGEYVDLVASAAGARPVQGRRAFDIGTGTGVLAFVLARAGASVVATDVEPRAVACARENAERLGLADRVEILQADLFPEGRADLVVSNPPWLPDEARTPLERAVYDPGGAFVERLVLGLPDRLADGGEAWIVISDLAELLGLRPARHVEALAARAGLRVADVRETKPAHPRARDREDPLHAFRARETTRLWRLVRAQDGPGAGG